MRINFVRSCECILHQENQCAGKPVDWRKEAQHANTSCVECCFASLNRGLTVLSNGLASIFIDMHEHTPTSFTAETFSSCLSWLRSPSPHYVDSIT